MGLGNERQFREVGSENSASIGEFDRIFNTPEFDCIFSTLEFDCIFSTLEFDCIFNTLEFDCIFNTPEFLINEGYSEHVEHLSPF